MTRKDEFLEKFKALLREYDAEIKVQTDDPYDRWPTYGIEIFANAIYKNCECIAEGFEINLGGWENGK